jgi:hypothetical protein
MLKTLDVAETAVLGTASVASFHHAVARRKEVSAAAGSSQVEFVGGLVLAALLIRKAAVKIVDRQREASPTSQAMLRLRNAEVAIEQQAVAVDSVLRKIDALKTKTRLVSRDVKDTVKVVEETRAVTGDVLQDTNAKVEMLGMRVDDVEVLMGSVHEVVSKQLNLIRGVISEQKTVEARLLQGIVRDEGPQQGEKKPGEKVGRNVIGLSDNTSFSIDDESEVHSAKVASSASPEKGITTDEWGRITSKSITQTKDGVLYSFDSS